MAELIVFGVIGGVYYTAVAVWFCKLNKKHKFIARHKRIHNKHLRGKPVRHNTWK